MIEGGDIGIGEGCWHRVGEWYWYWYQWVKELIPVLVPSVLVPITGWCWSLVLVIGIDIGFVLVVVVGLVRSRRAIAGSNKHDQLNHGRYD